MNALMMRFWENREENKLLPIFGIVANKNNKIQPQGFVIGWTLKKKFSEQTMQIKSLSPNEWEIKKFTYSHSCSKQWVNAQ